MNHKMTLIFGHIPMSPIIDPPMENDIHKDKFKDGIKFSYNGSACEHVDFVTTVVNGEKQFRAELGLKAIDELIDFLLKARNDRLAEDWDGCITDEEKEYLSNYKRTK